MFPNTLSSKLSPLSSRSQQMVPPPTQQLMIHILSSVNLDSSLTFQSPVSKLCQKACKKFHLQKTFLVPSPSLHPHAHCFVGHLLVPVYCPWTKILCKWFYVNLIYHWSSSSPLSEHTDSPHYLVLHSFFSLLLKCLTLSLTLSFFKFQLRIHSEACLVPPLSATLFHYLSHISQHLD